MIIPQTENVIARAYVTVSIKWGFCHACLSFPFRSFSPAEDQMNHCLSNGLPVKIADQPQKGQ